MCCPDGWKLVYAGSRFTQGAESGYSPSKGEALAVSWSLQHAKFFVTGCKDLLVVTDHKPLLGLFKDRDLNSVTNTRLQKFKERTFRYSFKTQYCPGKWHRGADAVSRNPVPVLAIIAETPHEEELQAIHELESLIHASCDSICSIVSEPCSNDNSITFADVRNAAISDCEYGQLISAGFNDPHDKTKPALRQYCNVKDRLSIYDGMVFSILALTYQTL